MCLIGHLTLKPKNKQLIINKSPFISKIIFWPTPCIKIMNYIINSNNPLSALLNKHKTKSQSIFSKCPKIFQLV